VILRGLGAKNFDFEYTVVGVMQLKRKTRR
jgi:hypothetical protein